MISKSSVDSSVAFASEAFLDAYRAIWGASSTLDWAPGSCTIKHVWVRDGNELGWTETIRSEQVVGVADLEERAELIIRYGPPDPVLHLDPTVSADESLASIRVAKGPQGPDLPFPPLAQLERLSSSCRLPHATGATFTTEFTVTEGPCGPTTVWVAFVDGQIDGTGFGRANRTDVQVVLRFADLLGLGAGESTIGEVLAGGGVDGHWSAVSALVGIIQERAFQDSLAQSSKGHRCLRALAQARSVPLAAARLRVLAALTS